jgi:hypothetical protein
MKTCVEKLDNCIISAVLMKIKVFYDVTLCRRGIVLYVSNERTVLCSRAYSSLCFEELECHHLQGQIVQEESQKTE